MLDARASIDDWSSTSRGRIWTLPGFSDAMLLSSLALEGDLQHATTFPFRSVMIRDKIVKYKLQYGTYKERRSLVAPLFVQAGFSQTANRFPYCLQSQQTQPRHRCYA